MLLEIEWASILVEKCKDFSPIVGLDVRNLKWKFDNRDYSLRIKTPILRLKSSGLEGLLPIATTYISQIGCLYMVGREVTPSFEVATDRRSGWLSP